MLIVYGLLFSQTIFFRGTVPVSVRFEVMRTCKLPTRTLLLSAAKRPSEFVKLVNGFPCPTSIMPAKGMEIK